MMTSLGSERARGTRDKVQTPATQTQPQKQVQATAEQIRLAQMIYDKNDADFEDKVKQLMEVTGKNQDECIVALHDCNEDVTRAINILLEGNSDTTSWETVGKKKSLGKDGSENKENREKRGEREMSRGRGGASRRGRGASRGRELRTEENGVDLGPGDRVSDRGRRGRGRGFGGRGRGRAAGGSRFSAQGMGTFNPADYTDSSASGGGGSKTEAWESGNDGDDGTGAWRSTMDDWAAEDWNEDLSETKVFTASSASPIENHITPGQSIDLVALLQKPAAGGAVGELNSYDPSQQHQQQSLGNSLVFTNSQIPSVTSNATAVNPYSHHMLSSVLSSGFGELGSSKLPSSAGAQTLEQLKSPGLGPLPSQQIGVSAVGGSSSVSTSSWDIKPLGSRTTVLSQFIGFKTQPEPSPVLSQLTQRQQQQQPSLSLSSQSSLSMLPPPPGLDTYPPQTKLRDPTPPDSAATAAIVTAAKLLHMPPGAIDTQAGSTQQKQLKLQKRRIPPTSKIPSSAVEMPASADVTGLTFQFGALEFGSEPSLQEFGSAESNSDTPSQTQNSLYSKPVSDSLSSSLSMPISAPDSSYSPPVVTSSSLPALPQSSAPPVTSPGPSLEQNAVHSRIAFQSSLAPSPQEEPPAPTTVSNGFNGVRTPTGLDTTSTASTPKPESPSLPSSLGPLSSSAPAASALLPTSVPQHSTALTSMGQNSELSTAPLPQLSNSLSNHQNSHSPASVLSSSSSHTYTSVDSVSSLQPSSNFSAASTCSSSNASAMVNVANTLHMTSSLGLSSNSVSIPSATRSAHLLSSTAGKAPPNLPQGVPPLLHNQYIVGPGGLLPAYPIYGYEDLQMLQSRLPMDYYGIPFPGPTATLPGRDGSLANNPYSGEVTKFGRGDSASPAPTTSLAQPLQQQSQTQQTHHTTQQAFLNPALPPGYSYTGLPYYPGMPGVPSAFQYGPTMFVPPASAKQHGVGLNNPSTPFQQASGYGQHGYGSGYDDLTQGTGGGEYSKGGYSGSSQAQAKSAGSGPGKGVSVTSSNTGVPDISGSVYNKTQSFDKQGFHAGTPPPFSLPSALGGTGPLNPGAAQGYAPAPFLHILPAHQQPHSQMLHHHLQQDGQGGSGQRSQPNSMQQKSQANKSTYGSSPYWGN